MDDNIDKMYTDYSKKETIENLHNFIQNKLNKNTGNKDTQLKIKDLCKSMSDFLVEKNKRYGDSVLNPLSIFSKHISNKNKQSLNGMLVRIDDKLKRIQNSNELRENDCIYIIGYLMLVCIDKEWNDFNKYLY